ncbi:MAG TPA: hypothetical protein VFG15_12645 [Amycolatopsis sp.]|nr:hypothetical protein [Amycolatopsis sp.]
MTYQQYPPQGGYRPPGTARQPSGSTATIAGILAILGGLWFLAGLAFHVIDLVDFAVSFLVVGAVLDLLSAALLLSGGILLLLRKSAGRTLTVIGAGATVVLVASTFLLRAFGTHFFSYSGVTLRFGVGWLLIVVLIPAIATFVLALIPPTARWLAAKKQSSLGPPPHFGSSPPPPGYPPAPGAHQQGGPPIGQW